MPEHQREMEISETPSFEASSLWVSPEALMAVRRRVGNGVVGMVVAGGSDRCGGAVVCVRSVCRRAVTGMRKNVARELRMAFFGMRCSPK